MCPLPKVYYSVGELHCLFVSCDFPGGSDGKASAYNAGEPGSIPGLGRSPGEGNGNPLQYSCLENSMDWGAWWVTVHGVAKSRTRLHFHFHLCTKINLWPFKNSWWYYWIFSICPYKCSVTSSPCSAPRGDWLELSILTSSHMFWFQLRVSPWEAHADQMEVRREVRACVPQPDHCISLHKTIDIISLSTVLPLYGTF